MEETMLIGKNIRELRIKTGYSQEQLSQKLGVTRQTLSNWESGKTVPNAMQLNEIATLFQTDMDALVSESVENNHAEKNTNKIWTILLFGNLVLTIAVLGLLYFKNEGLFLKILIPAGPPILVSVIVWSVTEHALKAEDYNLIGGYNEKYKYNYKVLRKIIKFIQGYTIITSCIANFTLCVLSFFSEYRDYYVYVLYVYIVNFFLGIIYINHKEKTKLFL